jgi:predicted TIM-barrel fold metal-dependent hydrolase
LRTAKVAAILLVIAIAAIANVSGADESLGGIVQAQPLRGIMDVHEHIVLPEAETKSLVDVMDREGIATMVLLDSPDVTFDSDAGFDGYDETVVRQLAMKRQYPDRFRVFYTYPSYDEDGPRKAARLAGQGVDGLKFYNGLPMLRGKLGPIDGRAMYAAYSIARDRGLPVIIHVEALQAVQRHELERALNDFPKVTFICPHLCGVQSSLEILSAILEAHPNLFTDSGPWHRVGAFAVREPEKFRAFYIAHSDRIMFASDSVFEDKLDPDPGFDAILRCERNLLETRYFSSFRSEDVMLGLYLPRAALEDIFFRTATRLFPPHTLPAPERKTRAASLRAMS